MTAELIADSSRPWGIDRVPALGAGSPASIPAAIWSGPPMELCSAPLDVTVLSVALGTHGADVFAAQRLRGSLKFRHGDLQLMQRGVSPRAAMGEGWRMLHSYLPQSLLMPISAIAAQVSSGDPSHFARPFRREVGTRPAPYRRERWS